jgi:hypothetical protein
MSQAAPVELAPILEIKHFLLGGQKRFHCRQLSTADGHAVVLWIATAPMHVHGVTLPTGTVSFGHFWADRFYNVYHWVGPSRRTVGYYFNIADQTRIAGEVLEWRDLIVDVIATPEGRLEVLDEDELPADPPPDVAEHIAAGRAAILGNPAALMAEVEAASQSLFPLVFPGVSGQRR